jgi:SAM-dependent methyltransferase
MQPQSRPSESTPTIQSHHVFRMTQLPSPNIAPGSWFEPDVAHPARVYNCWIGGKDHFPADRQAANRVAQCRPQVISGARANRAFLARVVRYLTAERAISQFLDIGPGLPAPGNTHEVAQAIDPQCRVVYLDNDPLVLAYARGLLASDPRGECAYVEADLRDPAVILREARRTLDFTRPVAVLLVAVLHFIPGAEDPAGIVEELAEALAPGSFIAISHLTADFAPDQVTSGVAAYNSLVPAGITARSHSQVTALLSGLSLVPPGVVPMAEWRPVTGYRPQATDMYAGLVMTGRRGWMP